MNQGSCPDRRCQKISICNDSITSNPWSIPAFPENMPFVDIEAAAFGLCECPVSCCFSQPWWKILCIGWRLKLHWCTGWACTKYGHEMTVGELLQPLNTDSPDYLSIHPSIYSFIYSSIYLFESLYDDNCPHQGNRTERKQAGLFGATKSRLVSNLTVLGLKLGRTGAHFGPKCANFRSPVHFFAACPGRTFPPSVEAAPVWQICPYCSLLKFC